ncbi:hypothetical protein D8S78_06665 [Natrialba swarupiae]|nr:hypothetical protein [Natrialba swarupiae]
MGGSGIGASMLIGSGAFSRIESQRRVKIEVAKDPHAYLGLDGCPDSPNASYTNIDESGHLEVDMSSENPTDAGGEGSIRTREPGSTTSSRSVIRESRTSVSGSTMKTGRK